MKRFKCPQGYRQNPPKSGKCVETLKSTKKLKQTKKRSLTTSMEYSPRFHNIAGHIPLHRGDGISIKEMVYLTIRNDPLFKPGDIIYIGSAQKMTPKSFVIINRQGKATGYKDDAISLPITYKSQLPKKINYASMIHKAYDKMNSTIQDTTKTSNHDFGKQFFAGRDVESIISEYESHGLA